MYVGRIGVFEESIETRFERIGTPLRSGAGEGAGATDGPPLSPSSGALSSPEREETISPEYDAPRTFVGLLGPLPRGVDGGRPCERYDWGCCEARGGCLTGPKGIDDGLSEENNDWVRSEFGLPLESSDGLSGLKTA